MAVNAFLLAIAAGMITAAALGDRWGRRRFFVAGMFVFAAGSAGCALAPSVVVLIVARVVQGIGAAIVTPLALTIVTTAFPAERRGSIIGVFAGIGGLAIAAAPLITGLVLWGLDWRWLFWAMVIVGLVIAVLAAIRLGESHGSATRLDPVGVILVSGGSLGVVWGLVRAGDAGWSSGQVVGALVVGGFLVAGFLVWESRVTAPMLALRLFRVPAFSAVSAAAFLMFGSFLAAIFLAAQYFQFALRYSALDTGVRFLPLTGMLFLASPIAGRLSDRVGSRPILIASMLLQAVGFGWLALVSNSNSQFLTLVPAMVVAGIGTGAAGAMGFSAALSAVAAPDMGKASGIINTLQRFGGAFSVALVSAVFAANGHLGSPQGVTAGFRPALAVCAALSLLGAVAAVGVARRREVSTGASAPDPVRQAT